ncbi:MAG: hypothetical protein ACLRRN_05080 [Oscillospiraceae bacterium]
MKKELFAGALLFVLIAGCAWNLWYLTRMCTQLDNAVAQAETSYAAGDPARAVETLRAAALAGVTPRTMPTVCSHTRAQTP